MARAQRPTLSAADDDDEDEEQDSQPLSQASQEASLAGSRLPSPRLRSRQASPSPATFGQSRNAALESQEGRTRTYGAGVRSHLAAIPIDAANGTPSTSAEPEASLLARDRWTETQDSQQRESYAEMRRKYVIEGTGADESLNSAGGDPALRSLTNLRSAGALKRFLDELNYTLAGLDPRTASLSARQSSSIEIAKSVCGQVGASDEEEEQDASSSENGDEGGQDDDGGPTHSAATTFLYRLKATNAYGKVWTALRSAEAGNGTDEVLDWSLLLVLHRLTDPRIMGSSLFDAHGADVWSALRLILAAATERARSDGGVGEGQAAQSKKGKGKKSARAQNTPRAKLHQLSVQSGLVAPDAQGEPSLVLIAVSVIAAIVQIPRSPSCDPRQSILERPLSLQDLGEETENPLLSVVPLTLLGAIVRELMRQSDGAGMTFINWSAGNATPLPASFTPSFEVLAVLARIFETLVGSLDEVAQGSTFTGLAADNCKELVASSVVDIVRYLRHRSGSRHPACTDQESLQALATLGDWLKVLISLTQGQESWCKAVSSRTAAIGTLVNLIVELSPRSVGGGTHTHDASRKGKDRVSTSSAAPSVLDADALRHDALCLAVALLTNLLEHDPSTADHLTTIRLDSACYKRSCFVDGTCECGGRDALPAMPKLFDLVAKGWQRGSLRTPKSGTAEDEAAAVAAAADMAHTEILRASIALALGLAIRHQVDNARCLERQRGGPAALATLADILDDLAPLHRDVVQRSMSSLEGSQGGGGVRAQGGVEEGGEPDVVGSMAAMLRGMYVQRRGDVVPHAHVV